MREEEISPLTKKGYSKHPYRMAAMAKTATKVFELVTGNKGSDATLFTQSEAHMILDIVEDMLQRVEVQ